MSGSVLRLTLLVVVSVLSDYSVVLQRAETFVQQPFRIRTNFLRDFMRIRNELFPYSFTSPSPVDDDKAVGSYYVEEEFQDQNVTFDESESRNSVVVKRRVPEVLLENPRIRNFLRQRVRDKFINSRTDSTRKSRSHQQFTPNPDNQGNSSSELTKDVILNNNNNNNSNAFLLTNETNQDPSSIELSIEVENTSYTTTSAPTKATTTKVVETTTPKSVKTTTEGTFDISLDELTSSDAIPETSNEEGAGNIVSYFFATLTQLPIIGNVLRASVDPLYRPIVNRIRPDAKTWDQGGAKEQEDSLEEDWCFGAVLGCLEPTVDFFHPVYRPVNLPPNSRDYIKVHFSVHSREEPKGFEVSAQALQEHFLNSTYLASRPTKIIIHGFLHDRHETWVWEMVRGFLIYSDSNVITVDWSSGSHALYSQATANTRVVALEIVRLLNYIRDEYSASFEDFHIVGHSLGAHTAGYVGASVERLGRITGLDPAEPYFQYMPASVRLDPTDALFVDVLHTDIDSFFPITGPRGFGLRQAVGHIDFYPNGGYNQPGCNQLLTRIPYTLTEGQDIVEGINAAQTELMSCDHIRAPKLFTDSLLSTCPYLAFKCSSYKDYKEGKCFFCGASGEDCASMGIDADKWSPGNKTNVKMFLDTHHSPNFCLYHYLLTINFNDPVFSTGTLRGRLEITLITEEGDLRKFDLTSLSPIKFPRRGSKTFILVHNEDLSGSQEALLSWTFESDLMDPFSFCVLFCRADLSISSVSLTSVDSLSSEKIAQRLRENFSKRKGGLTKTHSSSVWQEAVMCHKKGDRVALIRNKETIKISASPLCNLMNKGSEYYKNQNDYNVSTKHQRVTLLH